MSLGSETLPLPIGDVDLGKKAEELGIKYFLPCVTTLTGSIRSDIVPRSAAKQLQTRGFASMALGVYGVDGCDPEIMCVPDPKTLIQLPWDPEIGWLACDVYFKGKRFDQCPRLVLQKQCQQAKEMGYVMKSGVEPEFLLLAKDKHEPLTKEEELVKYQDPINSLLRKKFLTRILDYMDQLGWEPYQALHEASSNQYEINFGFADALTTADRHHFMKFMIKEVARQEGYRATFMPKPFDSGFCMNGLHIHISVWSAGGDENVFPDAKGDYGLSDVGRQFMAGVLNHAREMSAMLSPTVNSYKRLYHWDNSMHHVSFGRDNRWALIRIPGASAENDRFEYRATDGAANPYIMQAVLLAAGLDGIRNKTGLDPKQLLEDDMFEKPELHTYEDLPRTLNEAGELLQNSNFVKEQLGAGIVKGYSIVIRLAWKEYCREISQFEIQTAEDY